MIFVPDFFSGEAGTQRKHYAFNPAGGQSNLQISDSWALPNWVSSCVLLD